MGPKYQEHFERLFLREETFVDEAPAKKRGQDLLR